MTDPEPGLPRFVAWPDPVLKTRAVEVDAVDDDVRRIWDTMLSAMYAMPGVGLAAPQIGLSRRLAVLDCAPSKDQPLRLANPRLLSASDALLDFEEASPNLPGRSAMVRRPAEVRVQFLDESGVSVERDFDGLWAVSVQHQIDHLDGMMFFDRLSSVRRRRLIEGWRKSQQRARRAKAVRA